MIHDVKNVVQSCFHFVFMPQGAINFGNLASLRNEQM